MAEYLTPDQLKQKFTAHYNSLYGAGSTKYGGADAYYNSEAAKYGGAPQMTDHQFNGWLQNTYGVNPSGRPQPGAGGGGEGGGGFGSGLGGAPTGGAGLPMTGAGGGGYSGGPSMAAALAGLEKAFKAPEQDRINVGAPSSANPYLGMRNPAIEALVLQGRRQY